MTLDISETSDIAACRRLRRVVFIEEQSVPEADELDELDDEAIHLLANVNENSVGSARLLIADDIGKIGRVCVLPSARGLGIGAALIRAAVARLAKVDGVRKIKLGAQTHALGFYQTLGFAAVGDVYLDAGIEHQDMILTL